MMSTSGVSSDEYDRIVSLIARYPMGADRIAAEYKRIYPESGLSGRQVGDAVRKTRDYAQRKEERKTWKGPERYGNYELKRGGLVFLDFAFFPRGYAAAKFVLVAVDAYSKRSHFEPVRSISSDTATKAFEAILTRIGAPVRKVVSDRGVEFMGSRFQEFLKSRGIKFYPATSTTLHKAWMAERKIRHLRMVMVRLKSSRKTSNMYTLAKEAETFINSKHVNVETGMTPDETTDEMAPRVLFIRRRRRERKEKGGEKFELGDYVMSKKKWTELGKFHKSSDAKYGPRVLQVVGVKNSGPRASYRLRGADGATLEGTYAPSRLVAAEKRDQSATSASTPSASLASPPPFTRSRALFSRL